MGEVTALNLFQIVEEYNSEELEKIKKAYQYARNLHAGQTRQSGEPYINHPLNDCFLYRRCCDINGSSEKD